MASSTCARPVARRSWPPPGIESRAWAPSLSSTCSSCAGSASDRLESFLQLVAHLDRGADHLADRAQRARHELAQVERAGRELRPAAEGEEVTGEGGGAVGGVPDLRQVLARLGREGALVQQEGDVAQDAGEQIVEVVRDAAGELGDLAGAAELRETLLQGTAVGHVGRSSRYSRGNFAVASVARLADGEDPAVLAVRKSSRNSSRTGPRRRHRAGVLGVHALAVVGVDAGPATSSPACRRPGGR